MSEGNEATTGNELVVAALEYAAAGLPVLPLDGKIPRNENGLKRASADVAVIAEWVRRWPAMGLGIRTGAESGLVVLDVDVQHGGAGTLKALEQEHGKLPKVPEVLTGGGGRHIYFRHPGGVVRNSAGTLGPGLDVRGDGGYVVAPPSVHESGRPYLWTTTLDQQPLAEPPPWLLEPAARTNGAAAPIGEAIPEGERDSTLASLAGTMRRRGADEAAILAALRVTNEQRCKPPLADDELERIAASIGRYEPEQKHRRLLLQQLSEVRSRTIRFLVPGLIPLRTFTLVAGIGGVAKTMWLVAVAAGVTTGVYGEEPADVLVISYEDTAEEIWRPRLLAAQGDPARVTFVSVELDDGGIVVLPKDLGELEEVAREREARLIVIDPVVAAIDTALDAHKDQHVRSVLGKLRGLAESTDSAIAGLGHLNKTPSREAYIRVANSVAFWNAARSVVLVTEDDDDEDDRLIVQMKANWARKMPAERWRIEGIVLPGELDPETGKPIETARMTFVEKATGVDTDRLLEARKLDSATKVEAATGYLRSALSDGEWHEKEGLAKIAVGISVRTLERAAKELDVEREYRGFPATSWWRASG